MNVRCHICIGRRSLGEDRKALREGVQVVSETHRMVYNLIRRGNLSMRSMRALVMAEADEMLEIGFKEQMYGASPRPRRWCS